MVTIFLDRALGIKLTQYAGNVLSVGDIVIVSNDESDRSTQRFRVTESGVIVRHGPPGGVEQYVVVESVPLSEPDPE